MAWRLYVFCLRLLDYLITLPQRIWRLLAWLFFIKKLNGKNKPLRRLAGVIMLIVDLTPVPVIVELFFDLIKRKTRALSGKESDVLKSIFGQNMPYKHIGMDPSSIPARKGRTKAYVLFHTVNFFDSIPDHTLVHEMVHIWQYRKHGSVYISEAIWAQRLGGGYNYGGIDMLHKNQNTGLSAFNFEQQADVIEEYFRVKHGMFPQWSAPDESLMVVLEKYAGDVNDSHF